MATVHGSQFTISAATPITAFHTTGAGAIYTTGSSSGASGGLAVLSPSGHELDLVYGAFAATDNGSGDTLTAYGSNETITGSASGTTLNLVGNNDTAMGGGGPDTISVSGDFDWVYGGSGNSVIDVTGVYDTVTAGSGNDHINVTTSFDSVNGGSGNDTIDVAGYADTISAGSGATELVNVTGAFDLVNLGTGADSATVTGAFDTVSSGLASGANQGLINLSGTAMTLSDGPNKYADTVVGFDHAAGDTIHLTTDTVANAVANSAQVNSGADTLVTLSDGSTILLKGVTHIDSTFFS